ncbi:unnamed protein product [Pieris brassicae]|uniref:Ionotropic glutamate receptor C-terminal domain-containing protein n=1 Tax=Pieris brassicae TaxID=7116 RepID=A0A9P0TBN6_PIEBR|nr:unnamed protein product [Pieris brassicae]
MDEWTMYLKIGIFFTLISVGCGFEILKNNHEDNKIDTLTTIIKENFVYNGRHTFLLIGMFPDQFYSKLKHLPVTFTITDINKEDAQIEDVVPYPSNYIAFSCRSRNEFESALFKVVTLPYWHPLAYIILVYQSSYDTASVAQMFYAFWYFKVINVIIIHFDDLQEKTYISHFNPYTSSSFELDHIFGCWTVKKITMPISDLDGLICEQGCHNVSIYSKLRSNNLGTCLSFSTSVLSYKTPETVKNLILFEDKSANYHNYSMNSFAIQLDPFLNIKADNGTYTLHKRDGQIWNALSKLMNFSIDITMNEPIWKHDFDYITNLQEFVSFTQRKKDLVILPMYQFDVMVVELDNTVPLQDSGVCFMSHRAGFETVVFDLKLFKNNIKMIVEFLLCFFCTWMAFIIFNIEQSRRFSFDQIGKDFVNSFRTVLSISVHKPPKRGSFRIFLAVAIWSFFVLNFSSQAAIISFFSVYKKGKEVDTFDDILEKDYVIEGISSPDVVLPETEEKFKLINSKVVPVQNMFICPERMKNDSQRFCLVDCALGRFLERNFLNNGEQYLHIARQDRIHSHYLEMIMHKHSPMTGRFNKYMQMMIEGGLINKWIDYRFDDIKEEAPIKPLSMIDLKVNFYIGCPAWHKITLVSGTA